MRAGRGTLGVCLASVKQSQGGDLDKLACGLKRRSEKRNPSPSDVPSWTDQPVADTHGKSRAMAAASSEMKRDQSKASLILHSGFKALQYLKESMGRNSTPAASLSMAVVLSSAPSEEHGAGVSGGIGDTLGSDWPAREPRTTDSCGQYLKGEAWVSGWQGHPKLREVGFLRGEPLSAVPKGLGTRSELSYCSELCQLPYTRGRALAQAARPGREEPEPVFLTPPPYGSSSLKLESARPACWRGHRAAEGVWPRLASTESRRLRRQSGGNWPGVRAL